MFRKGNFLNIGLGREDNHKLTEHLNAFVEEMKSEGRIPADLPGKFKGHAYLLYAHAERQLADDGLLLIGDSAGLAYTQSGEGIRPAIESALMAADIIRDQEDYSAQALQAYGEAIASRFGNRAMPQDEAGKCRTGSKCHWPVPDAVSLVYPQGGHRKMVPASAGATTGDGLPGLRERIEPDRAVPGPVLLITPTVSQRPVQSHRYHTEWSCHSPRCLPLTLACHWGCPQQR